MRSQEQKLLDLLSNHNVTFFIPPYQRNYEWDEAQVSAFWDDVLAVYRNYLFFSGQAESASNGRARSDETDRLGDSPIQRCHGGIGNEKSMGKSAGNLRIHEFARKTAFAFGLGAELPFDGKERGGSGKALSGILAGHRKVRSRKHSRFCPGLHPTPHGEGSEKGDAEQRQGIVSGVQGLCQTEGCEIGRDACGPFPDGAALRRRRFRQMARA